MSRARWTAVVAALAVLIALALLAPGFGGDERQAVNDPELGPELGRKPAPTLDRTLVAALGDSITAGSPAWDPDPGVRQRIGAAAEPKSQYEYWARRRLARTRFRNCGVFGERTDEIARRLERCARGADVLVLQGGINDVAQMRDVGAAAGDLERMVRRGRELGLRVVLVEVLPWNNGYPAADPVIRELNRLIRGIGREQSVSVLPWYKRLEDPDAPGRMGRDWTADGDHPSVEGYRRLAGTLELP